MAPLRPLLIGSVAASILVPSSVRLDSRQGEQTAVVIDSMTPVSDRSATIARLQKVLTGLDQASAVACFELLAAATELMSSCAIEPHAARLFRDERRQYSGISVTLAEAGAILGGHEWVRDTVIGRECGREPRSAECGARVHAAAVAMVEDAEHDTDARLEALRRLVRSRPARVVVLVTAGFPFRHEPRALNQLASELKAQRARLMLVTLKPSAELTVWLSDAARRLASRLADATVLTLANDRDASELAARIAPGSRSAGPRGSPAAAPGRDADGVLRSLRDYVDHFAREMRFVIAHERYDQEVRSRAGSFGANQGVVKSSRTTDAEVSFAHLTDGSWIMGRQVVAVDGAPVPVTPSPPLADAGTEREAVELMNRMANDAARWNIGSVRRNINTPTLAMWFLTEPVAERFRFRVTGTERAAAGLAYVVRFQEIRTPPLMEVEHERTPASGRIWVGADSGAVLRTELILERSAPSVRGSVPVSRATVTVDYTYWPPANVWVPTTMVERYEQPADRDAEIVIARAAYSAYRQFTIGTRIK